MRDVGSRCCVYIGKTTAKVPMMEGARCTARHDQYLDQYLNVLSGDLTEPTHALVDKKTTGPPELL